MSGTKTDQKTTNEKPVEIHLDFREASLKTKPEPKEKKKTGY